MAIKQNTIGMSNARVYRCVSSARTLYLKIGPKHDELEQEVRNLRWTQGKLPVPEIIEYVSDDNADYLLVSEICGSMACAEYYLNNPLEALAVLAEGITLFHSVNIRDCPFKNTLDIKLRDAADNIQHSLVDMDDWEHNSARFASPDAMLDFLINNKPAYEELVFTHGDYCLPNIFGEGAHVTGFIDMGCASVADKWQDIALCIRSLWHNFHTREYDELLLRKMGISNDVKKLEYYILLDELF
jgi:kanamycin kinase/aminoglycoside 3'-phosphotransferase-3